MGYKLNKEYKHDYATPWMKAKRKLHGLFYRCFKDRRKAYPFYASYRHRNKKPLTGETSHYITEFPAYMAGFGHGLGAWRAGLMASTMLPAEYAYSPMVDADWDDTLGLGESFPQAEDLLSQGYKKVLLPYYDMSSEESLGLIRDIMSSYGGQKVVFYNEYEQWTKKGDDIRGDELIRDIFWKSPRRSHDSLIYDEKEYNIAVHIRRGDVESLRKQGDASMNKRWMELSYYVQLMSDLPGNLSKNGKDGCRPHFYIFSEGKEEDFAELRSVKTSDGQEPPVTFCLDMPAPASFLHICHADMILAAPSSFSIVAGAICCGKKIVPDRDWLIVPENDEWRRADEGGHLICSDSDTWLSGGKIE